MDLLAMAGVIGTMAVLLTTKVVNAVKPKSKVANYAIAFGVSTTLILVARFGGAELGLPNLSDLSWFQLGFVDVLVFGIAGGFWDALKLVGIRKPR